LALGLDCSVIDRSSRSRPARIAVIFLGWASQHEYNARHALLGNLRSFLSHATACRFSVD
jgi:hypothetical protein